MTEIGPKTISYTHTLRLGKFTAAVELGSFTAMRFGMYLRIGIHHERAGSYRFYAAAMEPHSMPVIPPWTSNGYLEAEIIWRNRAIFSKRRTLTHLPFVGDPCAPTSN